MYKGVQGVLGIQGVPGMLLSFAISGQYIVACMS